MRTILASALLLSHLCANAVARGSEATPKGRSASDESACYYSADQIRGWVEWSGDRPDVFLYANTFLRSGDRTAVSIVHAFKQHELADPALMKLIVRVLAVAFSEPDKITRPQDKDPAVTYLLLAYLQQRAKDRAVLEEITKTRERIMAAVNAQSGAAAPIGRDKN